MNTEIKPTQVQYVYQPKDDAVRLAVYNSDTYSSPQLQINLDYDILEYLNLTEPNSKVSVSACEDVTEYQEWLEVRKGGDFGTLSENKTATLPWAVRGSTAKAGIWSQSCKQIPCYADLHLDHLKIHLPRSIRLIGYQPNEQVNDAQFIKNLRFMIRESKMRNIKIHEKDGRMFATRQESVELM